MSDVSLSWSVSEPKSPSSLSKTGCVDPSITADQSATSYSCSATSAGGSGAEQTVTINRDATAPSNVIFSNGPVDGARYFPNSVPTAPTCYAVTMTTIDDSSITAQFKLK